MIGVYTTADARAVVVVVAVVAVNVLRLQRRKLDAASLTGSYRSPPCPAVL